MTTLETSYRIRDGLPSFAYPGLSGIKALKHAVFTRLGGVSQSPYHSLNSSYDVGDRPEHVTANLAKIKADLRAEHVVWMRQCHEERVVAVSKEDLRYPGQPPAADALITDIPGVALLVKQADCQSVILFDPRRKVLANAHCGWRGNVNNILGRVVTEMGRRFGSDPADLAAAVGPSLGPCCGEFVDYETLFPKAFQRFMVRPDYFDLWSLSKHQLAAAGIPAENIELAGLCTRCRTDLFYSYRGEGETGRFATVAMLTE